MTEREMYLLRQGIIQLLDNAYTAYKLINCKPAENEINLYVKELQALLNKLDELDDEE